VDELRSTVPNIAISTDVIVGFPGETDEQFENTLRVVDDLRFDGAFMFAYSIRPDTPAGDRSDQVPEAVKKERLNRLIAVQNRITGDINASYVGKELEVLIEGPSHKNAAMLQGYSREFKMLHFPGAPERTGRTATVRVTEPHLWGLSAELV
jgi:tRNA-2-methylthio-N6-dimethylallyladenosine synthase